MMTMNGSFVMPTDFCNIAPLRTEVSTSEQMQLFAAVSTGCVQTAARLVQAGVAVNMGDEEDDTPLTLAVARGHMEMVDFLLAAGADVNLTGIGGKSPLRVAIDTAAPLALVKKLLTAGADPLARSYHEGYKKEVSDLMAIEFFHEEAKAGRETTAQILYEVTGAARVFNIIEIVKSGNRQKLNDWLGNHAADINAYNRHGATALLHACQMGRMDLVETLWLAGADPFRPHKYAPAVTPLSMAQESGNSHLTREINRYIALKEKENFAAVTRLAKDTPVMKPARIISRHSRK
jgi:ankyrin repeat protein